MKAKRIISIIFIFIFLEILLILNAFIIKLFLNHEQIMTYLSSREVVSFLGFQIYSETFSNLIPNYNFLLTYNNIFGWYHVNDIGHLFYYFNHLKFLILLLILLIIFRKKFYYVTNSLVNWSNLKEDQKPRKIIFYVIIFLIFLILSKAHTGLFFAGISGWDNYNVKPAIEKSLSFDYKELDKKTFYKEAIISKNLKYVDETGFIKGKGFFLHFSNGEILPFNLGIFNAIFPELQYPITSPKKISKELQCQLIEHIRYSLEKQKKKNILLGIKYPNHTPYRKIDYSAYPESDLLLSISSHDIHVYIKEGNFEILGGKLIGTYKCKDI